MHEFIGTIGTVAGAALSGAGIVYLHRITRALRPETNEYSLTLSDGEGEFKDPAKVLDLINGIKPDTGYHPIWKGKLPRHDDTWLGTRTANQPFHFTLKADGREVQGRLRLEVSEHIRQEEAHHRTMPANLRTNLPLSERTDWDYVQLSFKPEPTGKNTPPSADEVHFAIPITYKFRRKHYARQWKKAERNTKRRNLLARLCPRCIHTRESEITRELRAAELEAEKEEFQN